MLSEIPKSVKKYSADKRDTPVAEFLKGQIHIATEHRGLLKPSDLEEYMRLGGFSALQSCLKDSSPNDIINIITQSEVRGRGGAGFPTGHRPSTSRRRRRSARAGSRSRSA